MEQRSVSRVEAKAAVKLLDRLGLPINVSDAGVGFELDTALHADKRALKPRDQRHGGNRVGFRVLGFAKAEHISRVLEQCMLKSAACAEECPGAFARKLNCLERAVGACVRTVRNTPNPIKVSQLP